MIGNEPRTGELGSIFDLCDCFADFVLSLHFDCGNILAVVGVMTILVPYRPSEKVAFFFA